jgi:hypothetical protein
MFCGHGRRSVGPALLTDGRVLVADSGNLGIRVLSADLQQVGTLTNAGELNNPRALELLPDGRLLVSTTANRIRVLEGFPAAPSPPTSRRRRRSSSCSRRRRSAPSPAARARPAVWCRSAAARVRAAAAWRRRPAATARARSSRAARRRRPRPSCECESSSRRQQQHCHQATNRDLRESVRTELTRVHTAHRTQSCESQSKFSLHFTHRL